MWHCAKRLLIAGALLLLAGARGVAQLPPAAGLEDQQVLPAPSALPEPPTAGGLAVPSREAVDGPGPSGPFGFSNPLPPGPPHPPLFSHPGPYPALGAIMHEHMQTQVN